MSTDNIRAISWLEVLTAREFAQVGRHKEAIRRRVLEADRAYCEAERLNNLLSGYLYLPLEIRDSLEKALESACSSEADWLLQVEEAIKESDRS